MNDVKITVAIPNYRRLADLQNCLNSILSQDAKSFEVLVHDDASPDQVEISCAMRQYNEKFRNIGIEFRYIASKTNVGYDCSLRRLVANSLGEYVLFIGNDDYLLPSAITRYQNFLIKFPDSKMVSRAFKKFDSHDNIVGVSKFKKSDCKITGKGEGYLSFRLTAYFGGLLVKQSWASSLETARYDDTLYYQFYLGINAFHSGGFFYIASPTVAARTDGVPLFGETDKNNVHSLNSYNVASRIDMWKNVIRISSDFDKKMVTNYLSEIRHELTVRMSFHLFEMFSTYGWRTNLSLARGLNSIGLMGHIVPLSFLMLNIFFGKRSRKFYLFVRRLAQSR